MGTLMDAILGLPPWLVLGLVFLLPAIEASLFVGLLVPGETAVLVGGILAHQGTLALWTVVVAAIAGAIVGDQVGYWVGREYGHAMLARLPKWIVASGDLERALNLVQRRGALAVLIGRWAAALRALVPGVAGMSGVHWKTFALANAVGGAIWATIVAVGGFLAGASYHRLHTQLGWVSATVLTIFVVAGGAWFLHSRRMAQRHA